MVFSLFYWKKIINLSGRFYKENKCELQTIFSQKKYNELDNNLNDSKGKRGFFFFHFLRIFLHYIIDK